MALWIVVGAGYVVRGLTGLALAMDVTDRPALLAAAVLTLWAYGVAFVTSRWALEATAFAECDDGTVRWAAHSQNAKEHQLALVRWLPSRLSGCQTVGEWAPLAGRTPLAAPWNVAMLLAGVAAAVTGRLLCGPCPATQAAVVAVVGGTVTALALVAVRWRGAVSTAGGSGTPGGDGPDRVAPAGGRGASVGPRDGGVPVLQHADDDQARLAKSRRGNGFRRLRRSGARGRRASDVGRDARRIERPGVTDAEYLATVARRAAEAGAAVAMRWRTDAPTLQVEEKTGPRDLVSVADRDTENAIRSLLAEVRPDDGVLGEESGPSPGTSDVRWAVDPIDGTTSYLYGRADWAVSVAAYRVSDRRLLAAAVAEPVLGA